MIYLDMGESSSHCAFQSTENFLWRLIKVLRSPLVSNPSFFNRSLNWLSLSNVYTTFVTGFIGFFLTCGTCDDADVNGNTNEDWLVDLTNGEGLEPA